MVSRRAQSVKRAFDIVAAALALVLLSVPMMIIAIIVRLTSPGPVIHFSKRVGQNNRIFIMAKFRTMRIDTPQAATHLLAHPEQWLTQSGAFLRKFSLDELPQLWNILRGDLSFVGPRPALYNQNDLVSLRTEKGIHNLKPGLTGWAQVNGRDELPIPVKVSYDEFYLRNQSFLFDLKIMLLTAIKSIRAEGVSH
jgi:O-antigen biosynthesis protein WbqP